MGDEVGWTVGKQEGTSNFQIRLLPSDNFSSFLPHLHPDVMSSRSLLAANSFFSSLISSEEGLSVRQRLKVNENLILFSWKRYRVKKVFLEKLR